MIAGSGCGTSGGVDAEVVTNLGTMTIDLYDEQVPETAKNFRELAKAGKYDGIPFHRVIKDFMIQGGDITSRDGTGGHSYKGPGTMIEDEFAEGLTHEKGTLSMANRGPNTGSSQFFIVHAEDGTNRLDGKHAIFGKLVDGYDVLDKIANVETLPGDKPIEDVVVETIKIMK
ncbi:MAG: peptidylprolyl isomerase [Patescibacteria group bacterium]